MIVIDALEIVLELAEENVLTIADCDGEDDMLLARREQLEAIDLVAVHLGLEVSR